MDLRASKGRYSIEISKLSYDGSLPSIFTVSNTTLCYAAWVSQTASPHLCHPFIASSSPFSPSLHLPQEPVLLTTPYLLSHPGSPGQQPSVRLPKALHPSAVPAVTMATFLRMCGGMRMLCGMWSPPWPSARRSAIQLEQKRPEKGRWGLRFSS